MHKSGKFLALRKEKFRAPCISEPLAELNATSIIHNLIDVNLIRKAKPINGIFPNSITTNIRGVCRKYIIEFCVFLSTPELLALLALMLFANS